MGKRYVVELGWGADLHGQDVTKAARRAVRDAISRSCLCGLRELLGLEDFDEIQVHVILAVPYPDQVRAEEVLQELPVGKKTIEIRKGGMEAPGLFVSRFGDEKETIMIANACIEVRVSAEGQNQNQIEEGIR